MATTPLAEVRWITLPSTHDPRGVLTAIETGIDVPFEIRRVFFMHGVTGDRGGHAHRDTDQLVIAAAGSFEVELFDGFRSGRFNLDSPSRGLYVPRMLLVDLQRFTSEAICLVLASTNYDMTRSIRSRDEFVRAIANLP